MNAERDQFMVLYLTKHMLEHCPAVIFESGGVPSSPENRLHQFMLRLGENFAQSSPVSALTLDHVQCALDATMEIDEEE